MKEEKENQHVKRTQKDYTLAFKLGVVADSFHDKTTAVNQMWQTDFTYF